MSRLGRQLGQETMATLYAIAKMAGLPVEDLLGIRKAATAAPKPTTATQLRLPLESRSGGRFVSPTKVSNPEVVRASLQPRAVDVPARRVPLRNPDQLNIPERAIPEPAWKGRLTPPMTKTEFELFERDPNTYRAIVDIANKASRELGTRVSPELFLRPDWSDQLAALGAPKALPGSAGGGIIRTQTGQVINMPPGALVRSPGGELGQSAVDLTFVKDITPETPALRAAVQADIPTATQFPSDIPIDVAYRNAAGGLQRGSLGLLGKALLAGGGFAGVAGINQMMNAPSGSTIAPGAIPPPATPLGQPTATPETGAVLPQSTGEDVPGQTSSPNFGTRLAPPAAPTLPGPGAVGTSVNRTLSSELIQAVQNAKAASKLPYMPGAPTAKQYPNIGAYYGQRDKYAAQPQVAAKLAKDLAQIDPRYAKPDIQQWAAANPGLAYELYQRESNQRQMPSQQMPQARGAEVSTSFGTDNTNNAFGSAAYTAANAIEGTQGAADISAALTPQMQETLQRLTPEQQAALSRAYTMPANSLRNIQTRLPQTFGY